MDSLQTGLDLRQPTVDPQSIGDQVAEQDFQKGSRPARPVRGAVNLPACVAAPAPAARKIPAQTRSE